MPSKKTPKKPPKRTRSEYVPHVEPDKASRCHWEGCREPGGYKAPKAKDALNEYRWFCLEHIREHNQQWDYFSGMERDEIEDFMKDATHGHRPTWQREAVLSARHAKLKDALYEFLNPGRKAQSPAPKVPAKIRKLLAIMEMNHPFTAKELKTQYRSLVKKHHPDINKGNKLSEERFKQITVAYHALGEYIKTTSEGS